MPNERSDELELTGTAHDILEIMMNECFDTIRTYSLLNVGVKTLLLEEVTKLDWRGLSALFDTLFRPNLAHKKLVSLNIELIKAIKCIHDLYFNSAIKLSGDYGIKEEAVDYYLPGCVVDKQKLQYSMKRMIDNEITRLKDSHLEIDRQQRRLARETSFPVSSGWKEYLDLTAAQKESSTTGQRTQFFLNFNERLPNVLSPSEHLLLSPGVDKVLLAHQETIVHLRSLFDLSSLVLLTANELQSVLQHALQFNVLAGLEVPQRFRSVIDSDYELRMVVSFNDLITKLPHAQRIETLKSASSILFLLLKLDDLALEDLFAIDANARKKILDNPEAIRRLSSYPGNTPVEVFKKMAPFLEVFSIQELKKLRSSRYFSSLINHSDEAIFLLKNNWLSLEKLVDCPDFVRIKRAIQTLLEKEGMSYSELQDNFAAPFFLFVIENAREVVDLLEHYPINLHHLSVLTIQQLTHIVMDPESPESQRCLKSFHPLPQSSFFSREVSEDTESPSKRRRMAFS